MSPTSITISVSRAKLVEQVVEDFLIRFCTPVGDGFTKEDFLALYSPEVRWYDHAFHICRAGHEAVFGLKTGFLHCNQPFRADLKLLTPTAEGAVVESLWIGCCANDIVRPDGEVAVKASGKHFKAHVCFLLRINQDGLITRIDEYYNKAWDDGIEEGQYKVVEGASQRT